VLATVGKMRTRARSLLVEWRTLLLGDVAVSRRLLRALLGPSRFRFYPKGRGAPRFYEIGVTPTLDSFIDALPGAGRIGVASQGD
jgi:hypothetical protein